jgi:hypothetical protein
MPLDLELCLVQQVTHQLASIVIFGMRIGIIWQQRMNKILYRVKASAAGGVIRVKQWFVAKWRLYDCILTNDVIS